MDMFLKGSSLACDVLISPVLIVLLATRNAGMCKSSGCIGRALCALGFGYACCTHVTRGTAAFQGAKAQTFLATDPTSRLDSRDGSVCVTHFMLSCIVLYYVFPSSHALGSVSCCAPDQSVCSASLPGQLLRIAV